MADITEEFQVDLSSEGTISELSSFDTVAYDISIGDIGFILRAVPDTPYLRQTAQYKKDQSDNSPEVGEQTLTGWWLRSQSSFHYGAGVKFFEPSQQAGNAAENQTLRFRFEDSMGVNVWNKGQVTLLNSVAGSTHQTVGQEIENLRSIPQGVLLHDGYDVDKVYADGTFEHFVEYIAPSEDKVYAVCDDGTHAYWMTNAAGKWQIWKKPLTGNASSTADEVKIAESNTANLVTNGHLEWVKERMIVGVNNVLYELNGTGLVAPALYTATSGGTYFTSTTASGSAVYVAYRNGIDSGIMQFSLDTDTLNFTLVGITAEMPRGEIINTIKYYLGYVAIGTNKGVRIAQVLDNGSLVYGPLLFSDIRPCYQFAPSDRFLWAACGANQYAGLVRIDLSVQLETLVFPYANDLYTPVERETHGVAFMGSTERLAFSTPYAGTNGNVYIQSATNLLASGYITTGRIRFNTLENKLFKFVADRAAYPGATSISISTIDKGNAVSNLYTVNAATGNNEGTISPNLPQEFLQFKFTLNSESNLSPEFYGYQIKALPAAKRQRLLQYPLYCFDTETDKFNNRYGYEGKAFAVITALENQEEQGDIVTVTDYRTGETFNAFIEEVTFTNTTSPDKRFNGYGGNLSVTVRKI